MGKRTQIANDIGFYDDEKEHAGQPASNNFSESGRKLNNASSSVNAKHRYFPDFARRASLSGARLAIRRDSQPTTDIHRSNSPATIQQQVTASSRGGHENSDVLLLC